MTAVDRHNVQVFGRPDGQPIMFSHGFGCDQQMWRHVAPAFADDHRVILFDHVGCGGSDTSAYNPLLYSTLDRYASDVVEIVEELDLSDVIFVGHSVSSMIGVLAHLAAPDRFAALALVSPSPRYIDDDGYVGGFSESEITELFFSLDSNYLGWSQSITPVIMGEQDDPALTDELTASFCRLDPAIALQFARVTFLSDNRDDLPKVTVPTLVVQCAFDAIAPPVVGTYVSEQIAGSELCVLDVAGHCPNMSAPHETTEALKAFVTGLPKP
jgi:sigma-B regulation protein RsbQ